MDKIDAVIAVLAIVAIVGSGVGLATYEEDVVRGSITFPEMTHEIGSKSASQTGTGTSTLDFNVALLNITEVTVEVTVDTGDTLLQSRSIEIELEGPDGAKATDSGTLSSGVDPSAVTLAATHAFEGPPQPVDREGASLDAIGDEANQTYIRRVGIGEWTVTVTISGDAEVPNTGYDIDATLRAKAFHAEVRPQTAEPGTL